jgi:exonuclease SbcD
MRVAVLGDPHLADDRLYEQIPILGTIRKGVAASSPDVIVIAGDLAGLVAPHKATPRERNALVDFLIHLGALAPVVVVRGNHDFPGDYEFLNSIRAHHGVYFVEGESELIRIGDNAIVCLPWIDRAAVAGAKSYAEGVSAHYNKAIDGFTSDLQTLKRSGGKVILVGHVAIKGWTLSLGQPDIPTPDPFVDAETICRSGTIDAAFFGHNHNPQEVKAPIPARYAGSLFSLQYGESIDKSWILWDDGKIELHKIPQVPRVRFEVEILRSENKIHRMDPFLNDDDRRSKPTIEELVEQIEGKHAHVKIVARYHEGTSILVATRIATLRDALVGAGATVKIEPDVIRTVKIREGAAEIGKATTLSEKVSAAMETACPTITAPARRRALQILDEVTAEMEKATA